MLSASNNFGTDVNERMRSMMLKLRRKKLTFTVNYRTMNMLERFECVMYCTVLQGGGGEGYYSIINILICSAVVPVCRKFTRDEF